MPLEELVGILTIYEQVIQNDVGSTKGKVLALKSSQKNVKKKVSLKASEDIDNTSDDTESDYEICILTNKIKKLLRKKESKRRFRTKDDKQQDERIICYDYKRRRNSLKIKRVLCQPGRIWIHPVLIIERRQT